MGRVALIKWGFRVRWSGICPCAQLLVLLVESQSEGFGECSSLAEAWGQCREGDE
jgi:hypothetical protein